VLADRACANRNVNEYSIFPERYGGGSFSLRHSMKGGGRPNLDAHIGQGEFTVAGNPAVTPLRRAPHPVLRILAKGPPYGQVSRQSFSKSSKCGRRL